MAAVATTSDGPDVPEAQRRAMLDALKRSDGRVTIGDAVTLSGMSRDDAERSLRSLLSTHEGHLEVTDDGELIYIFDPKLVNRDDRSGWEKFKAAAWNGFKAGFKVWIMLMLVVYFIIYVVLAIAAFVAITSQDRNGGGYRRSSRGGGFPIWWILYLFWTPDWRYGRSHYYGDTYDWGRRRRPKKQRVPFYKKVFAFVFGPEVPEDDPREREREIATWIRANRGVVTTAELVEQTGDRYEKADSEMARLLGAFDGSAHITDEGKVVYSFEELMLSADGSVDKAEAPPAWHQLEVPRKLTGNKAKANWLIGFFNGFNLLFALISPAVLFPILGIGGPAATVGLVWVPLIFSLMFFAVPALRAIAVKRENLQRHARNVHKLVLKHVFGAARSHSSMIASDAISDVQRSLSQVKTEGPESTVKEQIMATATEFDAEIEPGGRYRFPELSETLDVSSRVRVEMRLDERDVGEIVYGTADDARTAGEREMKEFEKEIEGSHIREGDASWEQRKELDRWSEQLGESEEQRQEEHEEAGVGWRSD